MLACILVLVGALNWGLVGLGWLAGGKDWNVVHMVLGQWMTIEAIVYVLVGVAALFKIFLMKKCCGSKCCTGGGGGGGGCTCGSPNCPECKAKM